MSRHHGPPLNMPTSASGITLDPQSLERVVAGTRRKDGTIRKELKVRPGFTPEEDKARYRNQSSAQSARLKSFVPGSTSQSSSTFLASTPAPDLTSNGQFPSLSAAQKKNLKRKDKRRAEKEQEEAKDWDEEEGEEQKEGDVEVAEQTKEEVTNPRSSADPNADPKQALRHLIQQTVTSPAAARPPAPSSSSSSTPIATPSPTTSTPPKPREKKDPRPGGLFGAALRVAKPTSSPTKATSEDNTTTTTTASDLNADVGNLTIGEPTPAESTTPTSKPREKQVKPGSGLYKDLGIQPKSKETSNTPATSPSQPLPPQPSRQQRQSKPTPPGAGTQTTTTKKPTTSASTARTRPEVRVRPGGGLGGLMKEIVEKNAGGK